jgi:hypothetical protein
MVPIFQYKRRHTPEYRGLNFRRHEIFNTQTGSGFEKKKLVSLSRTHSLSANTCEDTGNTCGDMGINGVPF